MTKRRHSAAFKRKILELTEQPGASVASVALEHGVNANLVFKWRRAKLDRKRQGGVARQALLLPVSVESAEVAAHFAPPMPPQPKAGSIEIEVNGVRVLLRGSVDPVSLRVVLDAVREST